MGKHDPIALYHAVMGEAWLEENRKVRASASEAKERQPRGGVRGGRPSARNQIRASNGARPAIFKRINNGGCKTRQSLSNQLDYVNDKAVFTYSTINRELTDSPVLSEGQKQAVIDQWSHSWRGSSKLGYTSHMLLSFPEDVTEDQVRDIALDWTEHFFDSGHYGDVWNYTVSVHNDRDNYHAHILLNNRGKDFGQWFSLYDDSAFSPQLMREKQAEIAEKYGVELTATTRLERGIFAKPAGVEEVYAAKAQGRRPQEIALTEQEHAIAEAAVVGFAKDYRSLADKLDNTDRKYLAGPLRKMSDKLLDGAGAEKKEPIKREDVKTAADGVEYANKILGQIFDKAATLSSHERPAFEIKAADGISKLASYLPQQKELVAYSAEPIVRFPQGAGTKLVANQLKNTENNAAFREAIEFGQRYGIDTEEMVARIESSGTTNLGVALTWIERDITAIQHQAGKEEIPPDQFGRSDAIKILESFQGKLVGSLGVTLVQDTSLIDNKDDMSTNKTSKTKERSLDLDDDMEL